jgi:acetyl-CoA carboxylase carboxyl transferase beta subunit
MTDVTVEITHKETVNGPPPAAPEIEDRLPDGFARCPSCEKPVEAGALKAALYVCPFCSYHHPIGAQERLAQLADPHSWRQVAGDLRTVDPLSFFDTRPYPERLHEAQDVTGLSEAFLAGRCTIGHRRVALGLLDFRFLGGSMGSVVGETFVRLVQRAIDDGVPLVTVVASGGARMQEGILSLMQMAKTVVALGALERARLPFVSVLTHPTTGGVLASFATLADVVLAEPGTFLTFAGPRVIEQTTREKLPPGFGSAESNLEHGQIDMIVPRAQLKERIAHLVLLLEGGEVSGTESLQPDQALLPRRGRPLARALAGVKRLAGTPGRWLHGGDPQH